MGESCKACAEERKNVSPDASGALSAGQEEGGCSKQKGPVPKDRPFTTLSLVYLARSMGSPKAEFSIF